MDSASSNDVADDNSSKAIEGNCPLYNHVTILDKSKGRGGNKRFLCHFCNLEFGGSYSRVKAHLLKIKNFGIRICSKVNNEILSQLLIYHWMNLNLSPCYL